MSTTAVALPANQANVLVASQAANPPTPGVQTTSTDEQDYASFEMANASILAAALGVGVYIDAFV